MNSKVAARLLGDARARTSKSPTTRSTPPGGTPWLEKEKEKVESGLGKRKAEEGGEGEKRVKVDVGASGEEKIWEGGGLETGDGGDTGVKELVVGESQRGVEDDKVVETVQDESQLLGQTPSPLGQDTEGMTAVQGVVQQVEEVALGDAGEASNGLVSELSKAEQDDDEEPELDV
jgi:hypothetical protein